MIGQLFQIKNKEDEEIMLLWCSDAHITTNDVEKIVIHVYESGEDLNDELEDALYRAYATQDIIFERVYTEEITI